MSTECPALTGGNIATEFPLHVIRLKYICITRHVCTFCRKVASWFFTVILSVIWS